MKPELLHILQHSLGVDQYGQGRQYRNHFVTGPGSKDWERCQLLVEDGLMADRGNSAMIDSGSHCFVVTARGKEAMEKHSPEPPKISRSARRYLAYLRADCGVSFGEWLKLKPSQPWKGASRE